MHLKKIVWFKLLFTCVFYLRKNQSHISIETINARNICFFEGLSFNINFIEKILKVSHINQIRVAISNHDDSIIYNHNINPVHHIINASDLDL